MIENTEPTNMADELDKELALAKVRIAELERDLSWCQAGRQAYIDTVDKVTKHIQDSIDREEWSDEELEEIFWEELTDMLDIELTKTVDVIIKAEWSATVKMKRSQNLDDLDISVSEPEGNYGVELDNVYESVFEITEG
jgi:sugar-specific transcriptional regulator TrmB